MFNKIKYLLVISLPLLITACQTTKYQTTASSQQQWQMHQQELKQITAFQVKGSIAHIGEKNRSYGRFLITQQSPNRYEIRLTTPIGTNILTLRAEPDYAQLTDSDGGRYDDRNVESLMRRVTNVNIPLESLHNWLKGYSDDPNADKLDNLGRLAATSFMQNNNKWALKITNYDTYTYHNKKIDLPATIELTHKDDLVRLKISNWTLQ